MDRKRAMTSVDLVALTAELDAYRGAVVDKAYLYGEDLVRLKLRDFDRGRLELLVEVGDVKRAHLSRPERVPDAPGRPPDFAKMLRNRISGANLAGVSQHGFDRILELEFRREDQDTTVVAELFGDGNFAVVDQNGEVVDCLRTVRLKSRTVAPGARYGFPSERVSPDELDFEAFAAKMRESDTDLVRTLATQMDLGGLYGEELCTRAGVEKTLDIADADEETFRRLHDAVGRLFEPLRAGDLDPRVYYEPGDGESGGNGSGDGNGDAAGNGSGDRGRRVDVTPLPLEEYADLPSAAFDSFNEALDDYFANFDADGESGAAAEPGGGGPDFEEEIAKRERIIEQQRQAIEGFEEQAEREREKAERVYARYDLVDEVLSTVRAAREENRSWEDIEETLAEGRERGIPAAEAVTGVDPAEGTVTVDLDGLAVELDPGAGVERNADLLYQEAKRVEGKKEGAEEAIADTRAELEELQERREAYEAGEPEEGDEADDGGEEPADVDWLSRPSIPVRMPEKWYDRFRWFHTGDGFLVIGGRNADQNEEIVEKYLDGEDLFFHTQAHGGPATVLKTSGPSEPSRDVDVPDASREQAAQFAVSYSSVWKDGRFSGDVYEVGADQVSKTPESGEYLEKGGFAVRGDRTYHRDTAVGCAVGITCEDETRVVGGPPAAVTPRVETHVEVEPGRYAQGDVAKRIYRTFRERFADTSFVRKVASPDKIQHFLPPGGSRMLD